MKKLYFKPEFKVVEIKEADIIATSTSAQNEDYEEVSTSGWFNS